MSCPGKVGNEGSWRSLLGQGLLSRSISQEKLEELSHDVRADVDGLSA